MSHQLNHFDSIARIYDILAKLVFADSIQKSQQQCIQSIRNAYNILWIGGGSGQGLAHLLLANPDAHIDYIEASYKMMCLAQDALKKNTHITTQDYERVHWHHATHEILYQAEFKQKITGFDHIVTFFFLDVLNVQELEELMAQIEQKYSYQPSACSAHTSDQKKQANPHTPLYTQWHWIDFYDQGYSWQKFLLWVMYRFFAYTCRLQNQTLINFSSHFQKRRWKLDRHAIYIKGFIRSETYRWT